MDGVGSGALRGIENHFDIQIRLLHRWRPDAYRFVSHLHMSGVAVGGTEYRHRAITQIAGRADDAAGNFPPIGNENLVEDGQTTAQCFVF